MRTRNAGADDGEPVSRRHALKVGALVAGTVWVAPVVKPIALSAAAADTTSARSTPRKVPPDQLSDVHDSQKTVTVRSSPTVRGHADTVNVRTADVSSGGRADTSGARAVDASGARADRAAPGSASPATPSRPGRVRLTG